MVAMVKLTREMIDAGQSAKGGWNANQLAILGLAWPPKKGWKDLILGKFVSEMDYKRFLELKG